MINLSCSQNFNKVSEVLHWVTYEPYSGRQLYLQYLGLNSCAISEDVKVWPNFTEFMPVFVTSVFCIYPSIIKTPPPYKYWNPGSMYFYEQPYYPLMLVSDQGPRSIHPRRRTILILPFIQRCFFSDWVSLYAVKDPGCERIVHVA